MISPLLLRSSLWVSFRVIQVSVARVRHWIFALQKGSAKGHRQSAGSFRRQDAEQRAPRRYPAKLPLQDTNHETASMKITHHESEE
jgi:hypothetical protein